MEKVYALVCHADESSFIAGIFSTKEQAEHYETIHRVIVDANNYDLFYEVETHTLNKPKKAK